MVAGRLTPRWTELRKHHQQQLLWTAPERFVGVSAGRRSGKTELAKRRLVACLPLQKPWGDPRYFFGGPTHDQAKRIAWQDLLDLIPENWVPGGKHGRNVSQSELRVKTRFGSELHVVGLDKPHRIEGVAWDGCVLDESSDLRPGVFDRSVRPALADRRGWCWRIGVPKRVGVGALEYRRFCEQASIGEYEDGAFYSWPSADILPADELDQARRTLDPKDYREQFEASWEAAGGSVFHAFDRSYNVRPCPYERGNPLVIGSDFNVDPMAWIVAHRYENRLEVIDELWLRNTNTQAALDVLARRYSDHSGGLEFYGDATGRQRRTSASLSDYQQILADERLKALGRTVHYPAANPAVADRLAATNALLCNAAGDRRLFISPDCRHLIEDLESRYYKPGTRAVEDSGDLGHITDALGYVVYCLFPIRAPLSTKPSRVVVMKGSTR